MASIRQRPHSRGVITLLAGALLLFAAWTFLPPRTPAILDGICTSSAYHYLNGNPPAIGGTQDIQVTSGTVPAAELVIDDNLDPQAQFLASDGTMSVPTGTLTITVSIQPVAAPAITPKDGTIVGNVYKYTATTSTGAPISLLQPFTIVLRAPAPSGSENIERFDGSSWTRLSSGQVGCSADAWSANTNKFGEFAVVSVGTQPVPTPTPSGGSGDSGGGASAWLLGVAVFAVVVGAVFWIRSNVARKARPSSSSRR